MAKVLKKSAKVAPKKSVKAAPAAKSAKKPAAKSEKKPTAVITKPGGFGPPLWRNVFPEPIPRSTTLPADVADAVDKLCTGTGDTTSNALLDQAPINELIAMFTGPALTSGEPYWNEDKIDALDKSQRRAQKKVYWAAESAKNLRDSTHAWFAKRLATTPAGCAHLLSIAAGDHPARLRKFAAQALRDAPPDAELWRAVAERLDPRNWIGKVDRDTKGALGHTYAVGAAGALISDPADGLSRFAPLLDPKTAKKTETSAMQATSVMWALLHILRDLEHDPVPYAGFTRFALELMEIDEIGHHAMFALEHLPYEPAIAETAARKLGPSPNQVSYWDDTCVQMIARSSDPRYIPWLAGALAASWMHWERTFAGLANIGDPMGIAIIEAWLVDNAADDRTEAAAPILAALRAKGEPSEAQRAEAAAYFTPVEKKKKKKR